MAEQAGNKDRNSDVAGQAVVRDFVDRLSDEHRMLVVLKAELYDGSWEPMLDDLRNRLAGKPYIFKLANRIKDDIERIEQMQQFEAEHGVDLADYVEMP
jgi:hypothetical protein